MSLKLVGGTFLPQIYDSFAGFEGENEKYTINFVCFSIILYNFVGPTLSAISRQDEALIILDGPFA